MPRFIMHHEGRFFEWSTVCDAAVTEPMDREAFEAYWKAEYGRQGLEELQPRLERAIRKGCSSLDGSTFEDMIAGNRMGPGESEATLEEIVAWATS